MTEDPKPQSGQPIVVCVKWAVLQSDVDAISGEVTVPNHGWGLSEADLAAVESALSIAEAWSADGVVTSVVAVCVGPEHADGALRDLLASGVESVVRVDIDGDDDPASQPDSGWVASELARIIGDLSASLVVCGDVSADRGSGSVPAFLAHRLGAAQALGLIAVDAGPPGEVHGVRRLDGARRELLHLEGAGVVSVEGGVAELRRASLAATIASRDAHIKLRRPATAPTSQATTFTPWRPRARVVPAPEGDSALARIVALTGAKSERGAARTIVLDPPAAAEAIIAQLHRWGYLRAASDDGESDDGDLR